MIAALADSDSSAEQALFHEFEAELRKAAGWSHLLRESGRYPLTGHGDINTYAVFAETARTIINARAGGLIVPTGIATDPTTAPFFSDIVQNSKLESFLDFENQHLWTDVDHRRFRFSMLIIAGRASRVNLTSSLATQHPGSAAAGHDAARADPLWSTRIPAPVRSSGLTATPRSPSASTSESPSSGATNPRRTPGTCRSWRCSTWPTTRVCSGPGIS